MTATEATTWLLVGWAAVVTLAIAINARLGQLRREREDDRAWREVELRYGVRRKGR